MAKKKKGKRKRELVCDPSVCDCCQYIGGGDYFCDMHRVIVIELFQATDKYLCCCTKGRESQ